MDKQAFEGLASIYDANRARDPRELLQRFCQACDFPAGGGFALDVGAGTGIATRQLRALLPQETALIGIEPGDDMRQTAVSQSTSLPNLAYLKSPAEALPFNAAAVDAVLVAQAVHWFDRPRFYAEAARVLRPGGILGLIQNNRNWRESPFLADYETILESYGQDYSRDYRSFDLKAELSAVPGLSFRERVSSSSVHTFPKQNFVDWSFSSSKMQACVRKSGENKMRSLLQELVDRYFEDEKVVEILYESELFLGCAVREE